MSTSTGAEQVGAWTPELPSVDQFTQTFSISDTTSYVQRFDLDERGRIVEWAVVQTRTVGTRSQRVVVYDTCHSKGVHAHFYDREGQEFAEEPLQPVASYKDLEEGLDHAVRRVVETWRENERRSDRGY
jgi:hypothetical protein